MAQQVPTQNKEATNCPHPQIPEHNENVREHCLRAGNPRALSHRPSGNLAGMGVGPGQVGDYSKGWAVLFFSWLFSVMAPLEGRQFWLTNSCKTYMILCLVDNAKTNSNCEHKLCLILYPKKILLFNLYQPYAHFRDKLGGQAKRHEETCPKPKTRKGCYQDSKTLWLQSSWLGTYSPHSLAHGLNKAFTRKG